MATDRQVVLRNLRNLDRRYRSATSALQACEAERSALYAAARSLDPPLTFKQIAEVFGVSETAVMQKMKRAADSAQRAADPETAPV